MVRARYPLLAFVTLAVVVVGYAFLVGRTTGEALDKLADLQARRLARLLHDLAVYNEGTASSARHQLNEADDFAVEAVAALVEAGDRLRSQEAVLRRWMPRLHADRALLIDRDGKVVVDAGPPPRPGKTESSSVERIERAGIVRAAQRVLNGTPEPPEPSFRLERRRRLFARVGDRYCLVLLRSEENLDRLGLRRAIGQLIESFNDDLTIAHVEIRDSDGAVVAEARGQHARETLAHSRKLQLRSGTYDLRVEINLDEMQPVSRRAQTVPLLIGVALFLAGGVAMALVFRMQNAFLERERALRAQAENDRRLAALGRLTAGVAHEIKNPLNTIRLSVGRLERRGAGDEAIHAALKESVAAISATVNDFMKLARDPTVAPEDTDPAALLEEAVAQVRPMAEELGRTLTTDVAAGGRARLDPVRVREALVNLLRNALQASHGAVAVQVGRRDGAVQFMVDDDGPGVPADQRREIFEFFYTTKSAGTGLGLSLALRVAEEHGGRLEVGDTPLGGARFTLTLPETGTGFA